MTRKQKSFTFAAMVGIVLLAFGLRLHLIAYDSVWWDEGVTVWMSRMPLRDMLLATANDTHPPLSYVFLHGWLRLVGDEEFSLRVLSVFFGTLTVVTAYKIGTEMGDRRIGLWGALFTAAATVTIWWSQEIRMYAQATFFAALSLWACIRLFKRQPDFWRWVIILGLSTAGGLLSMYLYAAAVIAFNIAFGVVWLALLVQREKPFKLLVGWGASQAMALVFFVPWITYALQYTPTWSAVNEPISLSHVVKLYLSTLFLANATNIEQYSLLLVLGFIVLSGTAVFAVWQAPRDKRLMWAVLIVCVIVPPLLVYMLALPRAQFYRPTPSPRYFVMLALPVYVLIGWGLYALNHKVRYAGSVIALGLILIFAWSSQRYYVGLRMADDYISVANILETYRHADDAVLLNNDADWPIFAYHYAEPFTNITNTQMINDMDYAATILDPHIEAHDGIWLIQTQYAPVTDPQNRLATYLQQNAAATRTFDLPEGELIFYAFTPERTLEEALYETQQWPSDFQAASAQMADSMEIAGAFIPVPALQVGNRLMVGLGWHPLDSGSDLFEGGIHIVDRAGNIVAEQPVTLEAHGEFLHLTTQTIFIPADAPTGPMTVAFVLGQSWHKVGEITLWERTQAVPTVDVPSTAERLTANFGDLATLIAVTPPSQAVFSTDEAVPLTLYWEARQTIPDSYKVFVHLVGEQPNPQTGNAVWGQQDQFPRGGEAPTTAWIPDFIIEDGYLVPISDDAPPGTYQIVAGLYDPISGVRLPLLDTEGVIIGDSIPLMTIEVTE